MIIFIMPSLIYIQTSPLYADVQLKTQSQTNASQLQCLVLDDSFTVQYSEIHTQLQSDTSTSHTTHVSVSTPGIIYV